MSSIHIIDDGSSQVPVEEQEKLIQALTAMQTGTDPLRIFLTVHEERSRIQSIFFGGRKWVGGLWDAWERLLQLCEERYPDIRRQAEDEELIPRSSDRPDEAEEELCHLFREAFRMEKEERGRGLAYYSEELDRIRENPKYQPWTQERERFALLDVLILKQPSSDCGSNEAL